MSDNDLNHLFQTYKKELMGYLLRQVRCRETGSDLLQLTFLRLAEQTSGTIVRSPRSYLYRTAKNLVIDHVRKEDRRQTYNTDHNDLANLAGPGHSIEDTVSSQQRAEILLSRLEKVSPLTRQVFELNRIEGLTYAEVADCLEISESSVQKHLTKALYQAMQIFKSI